MNAAAPAIKQLAAVLNKYSEVQYIRFKIYITALFYVYLF